jgi:hypothetical protein
MAALPSLPVWLPPPSAEGERKTSMPHSAEQVAGEPTAPGSQAWEPLRRNEGGLDSATEKSSGSRSAPTQYMGPAGRPVAGAIVAPQRQSRACVRPARDVTVTASVRAPNFHQQSTKGRRHINGATRGPGACAAGSGMVVRRRCCYFG